MHKTYIPKEYSCSSSQDIHLTVTRFNNKQQNKNLAPLLGKQKWNSHSSQPTPRAAKSLAPEPSSLFVEPQEKNPLNVSSLALSDSIPVQY